MRSGKKVVNFRRRWVFMDARDPNPRLESPTELPEKLDRWGHEKLTDPWAALVLRRMMTDMEASALTGAMLVKEFLTQRLAPLQVHSRPMWEFQGAEDDIRLCSGSLTGEELDKAMHALLEKDPGDLPEAHIPLYHRVDRAALVTAMPVFNELGLVPLELPNSPVMVSSGDNAGEKGEEDSEATVDDVVDVSPPSQTELLCGLSDDDDDAEPPAKEPPRSTGAVTRSVAASSQRSGRTTPKKSDAVPPP
jgi:hypothetical protein